MKRLERVDENTILTVRHYNALVDAINQALNLKVGPGLSMSQRGGSTTVSLQYTQLQNSSGGGEKGSTENPKVLADTVQDQDVDTWNRNTDAIAVKVSYVTDLYWHTTDHKLYKRVRIDWYDSLGNLYDTTEESEPIECADGVPHI